MKFHNLGIVAIISGALMAACVLASEDVPNAIQADTVAQEQPEVSKLEETRLEETHLEEPRPVHVAAAETRELDEDGFPIPQQKKKSTAKPIKPLASDKSPYDVAKAAKKGSLKSPYSYKPMNKDLVEFGKGKYMGVSCNGCHGGGGGGGMCPPLSNETWVYGADDDTLFRLIALGSDELLTSGYVRKGRENVVGPMPGHGKLIKTEDDLWRIIYFIRGNFRGQEKNIKW